MRFDFSPVHRVLARFRHIGLNVPIWWRDDDAVTTTPELDRLLELADDTTCPVHIAVIPAYAKPDLIPRLGLSKSRILVHGWAHANHAPTGEKKAEFGHTRTDAIAELTNALSRMREMTNGELTAVFVPPWNRLSTALAKELPAIGYTGVSTFGARDTCEIVPRLDVTNTHVDPIFWKGTRDLLDPVDLIAQTVQNLEDRLEGRSDPTEPLGLLTHHLVHTEAVWNFAKAWLSEMQNGGATTWQMPKENDHEPT